MGHTLKVYPVLDSLITWPDFAPDLGYTNWLICVLVWQLNLLSARHRFSTASIQSNKSTSNLSMMDFATVMTALMNPALPHAATGIQRRII